MRKRGLKKAMLFVLCAILAVAGWIVWDTCLRPGGEDEFDEAFLREFDPAYIIDHMDELRKTGLFEYQIANETITNPKRLIIWPDTAAPAPPFCTWRRYARTPPAP